MMVVVRAAMMRGELLRRAAFTAVALIVLAAGGLVVWYRQTYYTWPGEGAADRVRWCRRDYQTDGVSPQGWRQITAQQRFPIRAVGWYPPLGPHRELLAAVYPRAQRLSSSPPPSCATVVYLRTGPDRYEAFNLLAAPDRHQHQTLRLI